MTETTASARGARNREVGAAAEREAQRLLEDITGHEVVRMRVRVGRDGRTDDRADLVVLSPCAVGVEVKAARTEGTIRSQLTAGVRQMVDQQRRSPMMHRVVLLRAPGRRWLAASLLGVEHGTLPFVRSLSADVVSILEHGVSIQMNLGSIPVRVCSPTTWWVAL